MKSIAYYVDLTLWTMVTVAMWFVKDIGIKLAFIQFIITLLVIGHMVRRNFFK